MKKFILAALLMTSLSSFATETRVKDQKVHQPVYNRQGDMVGTSAYYEFDKLPKDAIYTITSKYTFPEYNLKECIEFTDAYGEKRYFIAMNSAKQRLILDITTDGEVSVLAKIRK
ncbi:MAG: hypothetical protein I8H66_09460 [Sphingobacteriia bacterium]|nr:hypothetical protein [Sphingobacteriia bacterium]